MSRTSPPMRSAKPGKRRRRRVSLASPVSRLRVLLITVGVIFSLAAGRAIQVQAIDANAVAEEAATQMTVKHELPPLRGEIFDRNGEVLALTKDTVMVVASPKSIATNGRMNAEMTPKDKEVAATAPQRIAELLARYLGGSAADYLPKLTDAKSGYKEIAKGVPAATYRTLSEAMKTAGLVGLSSTSQPTRSYPNETLIANVLGFVNSEGVGASGLELVLQKHLAGKPGREVYERSPSGEKIPMGTNMVVPAQNGDNYRLTVDAGLQWQAEQLLANQMRKTKGKAGYLVVTNPNTGEILALANYPTFDANQPGKAKAGDLGNRAITDAYTPGSVQKVLTFAALIDQGLVDPDEVVTVPGKIKSGGDWVRDAWNHPSIKLYARGILAKSSNIGTIKLARRATKQSLHDYMASFGLGAKTKVGLPGEAVGALPAAGMADYTRDGLAFGGSGVSVTLLQMAAAAGAVVNGGVYTPPQLLKSRTGADGSVEQLGNGPTRRVVSVDTSSKVVSLMEAMAQSSSSHRFDVTGYRVGAKTGTSRKLDPKTGATTGLVTSAISVAPVEDPQVLVYVVIDDPKRGASGSAAAGPVVQSLMSLALARYAVPQSAAPGPKLAIEP